MSNNSILLWNYSLAWTFPRTCLYSLDLHLHCQHAGCQLTIGLIMKNTLVLFVQFAIHDFKFSLKIICDVNEKREIYWISNTIELLCLNHIDFNWFAHVVHIRNSIHSLPLNTESNETMVAPVLRMSFYCFISCIQL